jgi:hypothetical protein
VYCPLQDHPFPAPAWLCLHPRAHLLPISVVGVKNKPCGGPWLHAQVVTELPAARAGMNNPATLSAPLAG